MSNWNKFVLTCSVLGFLLAAGTAGALDCDLITHKEGFIRTAFVFLLLTPAYIQIFRERRQR